MHPKKAACERKISRRFCCQKGTQSGPVLSELAPKNRQATERQIVSSIMKSDPVCVRVRELRRHYPVASVITLIWQMYEKKLCPHTIPRILSDTTNRCEFQHPNITGARKCGALFYAQKPYTMYCPECRSRYRSEILQLSQTTFVKIGKAEEFARVSTQWLYPRK